MWRVEDERRQADGDDETQQPGQAHRAARAQDVRGRLAATADRLRHRLEVALRIPLHLVGALEELRVGHELLHGADVHLARAQAGRADLVLEVLPVREVLGLEVERFGRIVQHVPELLRSSRSSAGRRSG